MWWKWARKMNIISCWRSGVPRPRKLHSHPSCIASDLPSTRKAWRRHSRRPNSRLGCSAGGVPLSTWWAGAVCHLIINLAKALDITCVWLAQNLSTSNSSGASLNAVADGAVDAQFAVQWWSRLIFSAPRTVEFALLWRRRVGLIGSWKMPIDQSSEAAFRLNLTKWIIPMLPSYLDDCRFRVVDGLEINIEIIQSFGHRWVDKCCG